MAMSLLCEKGYKNQKKEEVYNCGNFKKFFWLTLKKNACLSMTSNLMPLMKTWAKKICSNKQKTFEKNNQWNSVQVGGKKE